MDNVIGFDGADFGKERDVGEDGRVWDGSGVARVPTEGMPLMSDIMGGWVP